MTQIHPDVAAWMAKAAKALNDLPTCDPGFGEFYIPEVEIHFDGEPTGYAIVADDHGGYSLEFAREKETK